MVNRKKGWRQRAQKGIGEKNRTDGVRGEGACSDGCVFFVLLVLNVSVWLVAPSSPLARPTSVPVPAPVSLVMLEIP